MGIIARQGTYNSAIIYIGVLLGAINIIFLFPKILSEEMYGLTRVLISFGLVASQICLLGTTTVIIKFYPEYKEKNEEHKLFSYSFLVALLGTVVFALLLYVFGDVLKMIYENTSEQLLVHKKLIVPLVLGLVLFELFAAYARSLLKTVGQVVIKEVLFRIIQAIGCVLIFLKLITEEDFLLLFIGVYLIGALIMIISIFNKVKIIAPKVDKTELSKLVDYQLMNLLNSITGNLASYIDVLMIGALIFVPDNPNAGLVAAGLYGFGSYVAALILMPTRALQNIAVPILSKAINNKDDVELNFLYKSTSKYQLIFGGLVLILIAVSLDDFLSFIPNYKGAKYIILALGVGRLMDALSGLNGQIIANSSYYRFGTIFTVVYIFFIVVTNLIFIKLYGVIGAAVATTVSLTFYNLIKLIFVYVKFKSIPISVDTFKIIFVIILLGFIGFFLPDSGNWIINILYKSTIISSVGIISFFYLGVMMELKNSLFKIGLFK